MLSSSLKNILWSCAILSAFSLVTSFNLAEKKKNATADATATAATATDNESDSDATSPAGNSTEGGLDDRFNLNLNRAGAVGYGRYGGISGSQSNSFGLNAGIRTANGHYNPLFSQQGSNSNSFNHGHGAPLTFANTGSRNRPGYGYGGNANAGVLGGRGHSYAHSHNQNIEIPLDGRGTVLLSNLKERPVKDNSNSTASSEPSSPDKAKKETPRFGRKKGKKLVSS